MSGEGDKSSKISSNCSNNSIIINNNNNNNNIISNNSNTSLNCQENCLICGDVASGKHYGLRSCEACKAFFKRTVQGKIEYNCPATKECEINKRRRKACQACRFQKCLKMGMLKEGVRLDRVRGGRQKYRRGLSPGPQTTSASPGSSACSETNRIMTSLISCEPDELAALTPHLVTNLPSSLSTQTKTLYILSDLFDRELVSLIGWAKQIPGFSETITLNDQMRLLQSTWAEIIALSIGYRSHLKRIEYQQQQKSTTAMPSPSSSSPASTASSGLGESSLNAEIKLVFAKDFIMDFKNALACGAEEIFYNCVQLIKRLDYLKITQKEYMILKAMSLANADVRLENAKTTHQLRDLIMDTLYEAISVSTPQVSMNSSTSYNNNINTNNMNDSLICIKASPNNTTNGMNICKQRDQVKQLTSPLISSPTPSSSLPSSTSNINRVTSVNNRMNQVLLCLPVLRQIDSCIRKFWNDIRKGSNNVPMNKLFEEMLEPCQRIYKSSMDM